MATVCVVTEGAYSDKSISGIFSTWEKADQFIRDNHIDRYDGYNDIEEWTLDEKEEYTSKTVWSCKIDVETGDIECENNIMLSCGRQYTTASNTPWKAWAYSSVSQEHAQKLAAEKRQEVLRFQALKVEPGRMMRT